MSKIELGKIFWANVICATDSQPAKKTTKNLYPAIGGFADMFVGEGAGGGIEDILCLRDFLSNISELELKGDGERERGGGVEADCTTDTDWPPWVGNTS